MHARYQVIKPFNSPMTLNISSNGAQPFWLALDQVVDPQVSVISNECNDSSLETYIKNLIYRI
jgi:hypothetical protein